GSVAMRSRRTAVLADATPLAGDTSATAAAGSTRSIVSVPSAASALTLPARSTRRALTVAAPSPSARSTSTLKVYLRPTATVRASVTLAAAPANVTTGSSARSSVTSNAALSVLPAPSGPAVRTTVPSLIAGALVSLPTAVHNPS